MHFYGVISAIVFLGACRQLLVAIEAGDLAQFLMAMTLTTLVFNDALFTSHHVERTDGVSYRLVLKLIDLFNFVFLVLALVVINPGDNMFLTGAKRLPALLAEWAFWAVLACYWGLIIVWTSCAGVYQKDNYPKFLRTLSLLIIVVFALTGFASIQFPGQAMTARWIAFIYLLVYVALVRPVALHKVTKAATAGAGL